MREQWGQTGRSSQGMLDLRRVQHWEQQLGLSTQGPAPAPLLPRAERAIPEGIQWQQLWGDAESAYFREWRELLSGTGGLGQYLGPLVRVFLS